MILNIALSPDPSVIITHFYTNVNLWVLQTFQFHAWSPDRLIACRRKILSIHDCVGAFKCDIIFAIKFALSEKRGGIQQQTDIMPTKKCAKRDIPVTRDRAGNAKRDRLRRNGILSSSADGPLISAAATFPKCFVPCCFEPYSLSPRVYRHCHCLLKQSAVINPERFLRKLWPAGGQTGPSICLRAPTAGFMPIKFPQWRGDGRFSTQI